MLRLCSRATTMIPALARSKISVRYNSTFNSQKLLGAVADLESFNIRLKNFPTMVMFGPQSSGKSATVQALIGDYILPTDMKIATKKPTHITTLRSETTKFKIGDREFTRAKDAASEIDRLNRNDHVQKIDVVVHSPHVYNSIFIDLPGLFAVSDESGDDFRKKVKDITNAYVANNTFIPLIVHAAPSDPATNAAMRIISKIGRRQDSFGILTKLDMVKDQKTVYLEKMLNGTEYRMGHGYCAVVLPNDLDIERGVTVEEKIKVEAEYFKKLPSIRPAGIPMLRKMISDIQAQKISEQVPAILADVNTQIESLHNSQNFLNNLLSGSSKNLSRNLRMMIEKLVGSSQERAEFEQDLKTRLKTEIKTYLNQKPADTKIGSTQARVSDSIVMYHQARKSKTADVSVDKFRQLFSYGTKSPIFIDNHILNDTYNTETVLGTSLPLVELQIDDNLGTKRNKWSRQLNTYYSKLLKDETIHKIIRDNTFKLLMEYICDDPECSDGMSVKFIEYMINEIGNEAFESKIKYSITAMINIEKRPNVSIFEVMRYMVSKHKDIVGIKDTLLFPPTVYKKKFEIYGDDWIEAYSAVVIDNLAENCYRNVAVNLLDLMVEKLLEMTMDMFHKENAAKEQNKVSEKMKKLVEIREILVQAKTIIPDTPKVEFAEDTVEHPRTVAVS